MKDGKANYKRLARDLAEARERITELEALEAKCRQGEEDLRESEARYRQVVENANEAIVVIQDRKIKFLNPRAIKMVDYSQEELNSKPFTEFIHPDDRERVVERYVRRLNGERLSDIYQFRIADKDGSDRWLEANAILIDWESKLATLNFLTDITERKRTEQTLRRNEEKYRLLVENQTDLVQYCPDMG